MPCASRSRTSRPGEDLRPRRGRFDLSVVYRSGTDETLASSGAIIPAVTIMTSAGTGVGSALADGILWHLETYRTGRRFRPLKRTLRGHCGSQCAKRKATPGAGA